MQYMPGRVFQEQRKVLSWDIKVQLVKTIVIYVAQLRQHKFSGIGNIYLRGRPHKIIPEMEQDSPVEYEIGRVAAMEFFWMDRLKQNVRRGPFADTADFLAAGLQLVINENQSLLHKLLAKKKRSNREKQNDLEVVSEDHDSTDDPVIEPKEENEKHALAGDERGDKSSSTHGDSKNDEDDSWNSEDEDDEENAQETLNLALKLRKAIPLFFPPSDTTMPDKTTLFHHDLSFANILTSDEGQVTAILDWECVIAVPSWKACQLPEFLVGRPRQKALTPRAPRIMPMGLSEEKAAEWKKEQAWQDRFYEEWDVEWDQTRLRDVFKKEMRQVDPEWMHIYEKSAKKRDFDIAVLNCNEELYRKRTHRWLENTMSDKPYRRLDSIFDGEPEWGD